MQPQGSTTQVAAGPAKVDAAQQRATPLLLISTTPSLAPPPGQVLAAGLRTVMCLLAASTLFPLERAATIVVWATATTCRLSLPRTSPGLQRYPHHPGQIAAIVRSTVQRQILAALQVLAQRFGRSSLD